MLNLICREKLKNSNYFGMSETQTIFESQL